MLFLPSLPAPRRTQIYFWISFPFIFSPFLVDFFYCTSVPAEKKWAPAGQHALLSQTGDPVMEVMSAGAAGRQAAVTCLTWGQKTGRGSAVRSCTALTLLVPHAPGNMKTRNDLFNLGSMPLCYLSFVCCHSHKHGNKLLIKLSISDMQHASANMARRVDGAGVLTERVTAGFQNYLELWEKIQLT